MNSLFLILVTTIILAFIFGYQALIKILAERTVNVRKHIPEWALELRQKADLENPKYKKIQFLAKDNVLIESILIPAEKSNRGNIIFVHGIRTGKYYFFNEAVYFSKRGFNSILIDLRGHGDSEGTYTTFGAMEKNDISMLVDVLTSKHKLPSLYGIWGHSMGASIALQTLELDKRIALGILEAPFSNLTTVLSEYFRRKLSFLAPLVIGNTMRRIEKKLAFQLSDINPSNSAKNVNQPTILLHGIKDDRIKSEHSNLIFNNLPTNNKIIYQIKDADHHSIKEVWKNEYFEVTYNFINNFIDRV